MSRTASCPECGSLFVPARTDQVYCGRPCAQKAQLRERQGSPYRAWKRAVLERDGWRCRLCGAESAEHFGPGLGRARVFAHHVVPLAEAQELKLLPENGLSVCELCHDILHGQSPGTGGFGASSWGARLNRTYRQAR